MSPEQISALLYAGPGAGSLVAAAGVWSQLGAEWALAARGYQSVIAGLAGEEWLGPASEAMAAAVAPYAAWMSATAGLAEQTASRLRSAVAAFEEVRSAVVPPPVIAANRSAQALLVASNVLGQNNAGIAELEVEYLQMWMQDVVAMFGYASASAAAAAVTAFSQPPSTTDPSGVAGQAAVAGQSGAGSASSQLSQLMDAIPQLLNALGMTSGSTASVAATAAAPVQAATLPSVSQIASYIELIPKSIVPFNDAIKTILYALVQYARNLMTDLDFAAIEAAERAATAGSTLPLGALTSASSGAAAPVAAGVGNAATVGRLAVPASWVQTAPVVKAAVSALPAAGSGAAAAAPGGIFADAALASMLGRSIAATGQRGRPAAGVAAAMNGHAQGRLEKMVSELAGDHDVQHWHVDASRLDSLLEELAEQPGVHAVHVNPDGRDELNLGMHTQPEPEPEAGGQPG